MGAAAGIPAILSIASAGFSAGSSIMRGQATNAADQYQADRLKKQAEYGRLKADETSAQMGENLNIALGNVSVSRAAAGVDPTSPTTAAIQDRNESVGGRQITTNVNNIERQATQDESDAAYMRYAGNQALNASYLSAGASAAGAFGSAKAGGSFGFPKFDPIRGISGQ
jgi:hypothetical protein